MKKLLLILAISCISHINYAQEKPESVIVNYVQNLDIDINKVMKSVPAQYRAQVKPMLEEELKNGIKMDYVLKTNGNVSTYQLIEKLNNSQSTGGMIASQIAQADKEPTFKDLVNNFYKKLVSFPGMDPILIKDSLPNYQWKVTRENEKVAGYETRKATGMINDSIPVTAWFAPKISISDGPANISGLPGLILKTSFNSNGADITIVAQEINVRDEEIKIKEPKAKMVMTEKAFEAKMKEMVENMKKSQGGSVETD